MHRTTTTLAILMFLASASVCVAGEGERVLVWSGQAGGPAALPDLPETIGVAGAFAGSHNGTLIVAGGANFSDKPWSPDKDTCGKKVWHDRIYVLPQGAKEWNTSYKLDKPTAYGQAVATDGGLLLIGGCGEGDVPHADVILLTWDAERETLTRVAYPPLPAPTARLAAERIGAKVYVLPGHVSEDKSNVPAALWSLDVSKPVKEMAWRTDHAPLPGPARLNAATAVQTSGGKHTFLYVFGGVIHATDAEGKLQRTFLKDAYRFNPRAVALERDPWKRLEDIPAETAAACAIDYGHSDILLFGGVNGRITSLPHAERPDNPTTIRCYHAIVNRWVDVGRLPTGVVVTTAVRYGGKIVIPTGETRPGVRTPGVQVAAAAEPAGGFGIVNYAVVAGYLLALIGMGWYFSKREKGTDDYFLAGKRIPWWAAGMSIFATQLSAISFLGMPAVSYSTNWVIFPGKLTALLIFPIVIFLYLPFFRRLNITTAYQYLEKRFNVTVRLYGSVSFIFFQLVRMAIVVYLPALALSAVTGINVSTCIIVMGVLATVYTVMGGMEAVIWTDVLQLFVLVGGMLVALGMILVQEGGPVAIYETAAADAKLHMFEWTWDHTRLATWSVLLGTFALQFGPFTTDQAVIQRYLTTKSEKAAARSLILNGSMSLPYGLLVTAFGTCLYVFFKHNPGLLTVGMKNDAVLPLFVAQKLPPGVCGLVIAGVFAASMSTLDSGMHSIATAVTTDFYRRFRPGAADRRCLTVARVSTVIAGLVGTAIALGLATMSIESLFMQFQKMLALISSGLVGVFMLGIFTKRGNWIGALTGAAAGIGSLVYLRYFTGTHQYVYPLVGIPVSVIVGYVVSLLTIGRVKDLAGLTVHTKGATRGG